MIEMRRGERIGEMETDGEALARRTRRTRRKRRRERGDRGGRGEMKLRRGGVS